MFMLTIMLMLIMCYMWTLFPPGSFKQELAREEDFLLSPCEENWISSNHVIFLLPRHARLTTRMKIGEICMHTCAGRSFSHSGWDWWVFSTATSTEEKDLPRIFHTGEHRMQKHHLIFSLADSHYEYLISKSAEIFSFLACDAHQQMLQRGLSNFWLEAKPKLMLLAFVVGVQGAAFISFGIQ